MNELGWKHENLASTSKWRFKVKNYVYSKATSLKFPGFLLFSKNHYEPGWGLKTNRRLKNVIVYMDFTPSKAAIKTVSVSGKAFSAAQEQSLKRAFTMADTDKSGGISMQEVKEVLRAVDVDVEGDDGDDFSNMFQNNLNVSGEVSFEQLKSMLAKKFNYRIQSGRYYVALSLVEAGCLRAAIHNQLGVPFISGRDTTVALRVSLNVRLNLFSCIHCF